MVGGLLDLYETTLDAQWLTFALQLQDTLVCNAVCMICLVYVVDPLRLVVCLRLFADTMLQCVHPSQDKLFWEERRGGYFDAEQSPDILLRYARQHVPT